MNTPTIRSITIVVLATVLTLAGCSSGAGGTPDVYTAGRTVFGNVCSACHGSAGEGGVGPSLAGVLETFPSCEDHLHWVTLGSDRWKDEVGPTYGATNKPVDGEMPSQGATLSPDEITAAVVYERVRFGGSDLDQVKADCGVTEPETTSD